MTLSDNIVHLARSWERCNKATQALLHSALLLRSALLDCSAGAIHEFISHKIDPTSSHLAALHTTYRVTASRVEIRCLN